MKNTLSIVILIIIICLPSTGQICVLDENGRAFYSYGGIANLAEELFLYRDIYGEYPKNKKMLLDFILSEDRYDSTDSLLFHDQISIRRKTLTKLLKNRRNKLTISRDTCSFYVAKKRTTIRCFGGVAELQKSDSYMFRRWTFSRFFDKDGHCLRSLSSESPFMPQDITKRFSTVVTTESRSIIERDIIVNQKLTTPVLIPVTMTRDGVFNYDISSLKDLRLFYQEIGKPFITDNTIGPIAIEDALDSNYLYAMKAYLIGFFDKHEEVDSIRLWEPILFNNPQTATMLQHH